jgi:hypothetical protein
MSELAQRYEEVVEDHIRLSEAVLTDLHLWSQLPGEAREEPSADLVYPWRRK